MANPFTRMHRRGHFCTAPVGVVGSGSVEMLGAPAAGEAMFLAMALGLFLATGYGIFRAWGKPASSQTASPQGSAPALAG